MPLAKSLLSAAESTFERRVLVLSGDAERMRELAAEIASHLHGEFDIAPASLLWVGAFGPSALQAVTATKALKVLGSEHKLIVFDAWCGFHPDAFCAVTGTLVGGGLLVVITPPLGGWSEDSDYLRMLPYGYELAKTSHYFLARLIESLGQCRGIQVWEDASPQAPVSSEPCSWDQHTCEPPPKCSNMRVSPMGSLDEQESHLHSLITLPLHEPFTCVITADRGRGKTALLGRAAAAWMAQHPCKIVVTSAMPAAAQQVIRWAQKEALSCGESHPGASLRFAAPDAILQGDDGTDVLLVDEAAMLPVSILQALIQHFPRVVLASTVHGYEGSGRGLAIKLFPWLDRMRPGWRWLQMHTPIRWAETDPIERWQSALFCLNDELPEVNDHVDQWQVREVTGKTLYETPRLLHAVFGLLVSAHYRTTPSDLRDLLDGPNLRLWVLEFGGRVGGVCLLALEGGFEDGGLCDAILAGTRRPRGHLLPQVLAFHCHSPVMLRTRCARVVRIAVTPAVQRRGWGHRLVSAVESTLVKEGIEILGSSFALEPQVLRFWLRQGTRVMRIGASRESASGLPSCLVAKALPGASATIEHEIQALHRQFSLEAGRASPMPLTAAMVPVDDECELFATTEDTQRLRARLERFVSGGLPIESAVGALWRVWPGSDAAYQAVTQVQWRCSVRTCVAALNDWVEGRIDLAEFIRRTESLGRDEAVDSIRRIFGVLYATETLRLESQRISTP